jgi:hypothetical protein
MTEYAIDLDARDVSIRVADCDYPCEGEDVGFGLKARRVTCQRECDLKEREGRKKRMEREEGKREAGSALWKRKNVHRRESRRRRLYVKA